MACDCPPIQPRSHPFEITAQTDQEDRDTNGDEQVPHRSQKRSDICLRHVTSPPLCECPIFPSLQDYNTKLILGQPQALPKDLKDARG